MECNAGAAGLGRPVVHYVTAWKQQDIGGGLNRAIAVLPDDDWVCVRDGDSMFLTPEWGRQIEEIILAHGHEFDVIGAITNRLHSKYQLHNGALSNDPDIGNHVAIARERWAQHGPAVVKTPDPIAAMCMISANGSGLSDRLTRVPLFSIPRSQAAGAVVSRWACTCSTCTAGARKTRATASTTY